MTYLKNRTDNFLQIFLMGTSWIAVSINNIIRASREMTSRKNINIFEFNGVNVAKHWHVAGEVFAISDCLVRQAVLTTTKVPWFNGSTSWEQYLQVFDAIVLSNGWGDATAALQLLSHLQDDALSVALLIPMPLQASRKELTDALSSHYGSPGRLANYRREFDRTVRKTGEDPSNFAIKLETLAVKAFGNIGERSGIIFFKFNHPKSHTANKYIIGKEIFCRL